MTKYAIALCGRAESGKTPTLKMLAELLDQQGGVVVGSENLDKRDTADFTVAYQINGKIVAVATGGDDGGMLDRNCEFFDRVKCDIAITASRTYGASWIRFSAFCKKHNTPARFVHRHYENEPEFRELTNRHQAEEFLHKIQVWSKA